ncbi:MAG TPA: hypothetical protein VMF53_05190 [Alphaproteobacteria bacterium]|nr:hypothetical protein [Alphaproteobacteria bacterium]
MNAGRGAPASVSEIVGSFAQREPFKAAVEDLRAAGFAHADLSVLESHDSLEASESRKEAWRDTLRGLVGEARFIEPITAAGLILLASGTVGALISGAIAAGLGGVAVYEVLGEVSAAPHTKAFAAALKSGAVLLWVRAETVERQAAARAILERHGAAGIHLHRREAEKERS